MLVEPPDCHLIHYGKREILARIDAMEPEYEQLLSWEDPGPAVPGEDTTGPDKPWGDGITVSRSNQPLKGRQMPSLMADSGHLLLISMLLTGRLNSCLYQSVSRMLLGQQSR